MPRRTLPLVGLSIFLALPARAPARVWTVRADGTGDAPTIAAALGAAASGDEILLTGGTYHEHDLELVDGVSLEGPSLDPADAVLDAGSLGRVLRAQGVGTGTLLQGLTLTGGRVKGSCSDPGIGTYCVGGGALILGSAPRFAHCEFLDDHAEDDGGGLASAVSAPTLTDCRFEGNAARHGAAITFITSSLNGASPGDWIDCLAGQDAVNGNFSADPLFCGAASLDVALREGSPCAAPGPTGCGAIGAEGVACSATAAPSGLEITTWGRIKAARRAGR